MKRQIVIVGAGKGLGNHIAEKFGEKNFAIHLISRNMDSLQQYKKKFEEKGIETEIYMADALHPETLTKAFKEIEEKIGTVDVLVYNVGVTTLDDKDGIDSELLMERYQIDVASAYHCVKLLNLEAFGKKQGSILFTGGGLSLNPEALYTSLSLDKSALRAMAYLLHEDLKKYGIYVGTVTICGGIKEGTYFDPKLIAEVFYNLYEAKAECEFVYKR